MVSEFYHGTPHAIHSSDRPYLAPSSDGGLDEGDPAGPHLFSTPDRKIASLFTMKTPNVITIMSNNKIPIVVYEQSPPEKTAKGWLYKIPPNGFRQTVAYGKPSGKYAILAEDMPRVKNVDGKDVPGIPLSEDSASEVRLVDLIKNENLKIYFFPGTFEVEEYIQTIQRADARKKVEEFLQHGIELGWMIDITAEYGDKAT